jgi:PAS domain S-box-containing protein
MRKADLERELARLRLLIDQSQDLIVTSNEEAVFEDVSAACESMLGYRREEMIGHSLLEFLHPDDIDSTRRKAVQLMEGGRTLDFRNRYMHRDGTVVLTSWSAIWNPEQKRAYAVGRDITEWAEREEQFRLSFDLHPHPCWIYGRDDLKFLEVNEAACRKYGYSREEFLQMRVIDILSQDTREEVGKRIASGEHESRLGEWKHVTKQGKTLYVEGWSHTVSTKGKPARMAIAVDVSEKHALEDQFRHAQKMEAVGQLAGGLAHDFNNLLTIINGFAELGLIRVQPGDPLQSYLQSIHDAGERAAELTRQLLTFSRRQIIRPKPVRLQQVVTAVIPMLKRLVPATTELRINLEHSAPEVLADPSQVEQALMNLVINARDAVGQDGQILIQLSRLDLRRKAPTTFATAARKCYSRLSVMDNGTGIEPQIRDRIFEPFFTTKERGQGTGLGLSTVLGIVEQAGGFVFVDSARGVGTRVDMLFPSLLDPVEVEPGKRRPSVKLKGGNERILLVEDEEDVLAFTSSVLTDLGYDVSPVRSGMEALDVLQTAKQPFHLLLTDLMLPRMSGRKLIDLVHEKSPSTKTLCVSGHAEKDFYQGGVLDSSLSFLPKPYTRDSIGRKVREVLDEK